MKTGFNTQAVNAIDIKKIITEYSGFLPYIIISLISFILIIILPIYQKVIHLPKISIIIAIINFIFLFIFILSILQDFKTFNENSLFDQSSDFFYSNLKQMLINKFEMKPKVITKEKRLKNLFLLQLESYPNEFIQNTQISPNLNWYSKQFEYISPIQAQLFTTWSLTGTSVLQTGIPQIFPDVVETLAARTDYEYITGIQGISNILQLINYNLDYATTGDNAIMGFNQWVSAHKYNRIYTAQNDLFLYNYITDEYLPMLDNRTRKSNFNNLTLTFVFNIQTHTPYKRPAWYSRKSINVPLKIHQCFFCCDLGVNKIISKFLDLKMYEHTLMVVMPDHPPYNIDEKELFILFPGMDKVDEKFKLNINDITYYDFAPTILDLIGIKEYQPDFPFGRNIYLNSSDHSNYCINQNCFKKHRKPDLNDLAIIYKFLHFEHGHNIEHKYNISKPFPCTVNGTTQYSDKPCYIEFKRVPV